MKKLFLSLLAFCFLIIVMSFNLSDSPVTNPDKYSKVRIYLNSPNDIQFAVKSWNFGRRILGKY